MRNTQGFPHDPVFPLTRFFFFAPGFLGPECFPPGPECPIGWDVNKKMETISDLHFQCSLRGSNPRPQH